MRKGIIASIISYALWGFFPIYFHALGGVPAYQVTAHRFVWCFISMGIVILFRKEARSFIASLNWRIVSIYLLAGALLAVNWGTYVWAVGKGLVVETSLGYFINPIVSVLLGVVILREKLRPWQWVVVGLAILGVSLSDIHLRAAAVDRAGAGFFLRNIWFYKEVGSSGTIARPGDGNDDDLHPGLDPAACNGIQWSRGIRPHNTYHQPITCPHRYCHSHTIAACFPLEPRLCLSLRSAFCNILRRPFNFSWESSSSTRRFPLNKCMVSQ